MIHINILSKSNNPFYPHWDKDKYPPSEYDIQENSDADVEWDCVVVYQNIPEEKTFRCRRGNVIYFSGEPPMMTPMPHVFTKQFDVVVLPHPNVRHPQKIQSHGYLNWSLGYGHDTKKHRYNYSQLRYLEPTKTKLISIVSSNQKMMPGHNKRMTIIENLQRDYPDIVDVFGRGFRPVDFKADALEPYRFHICIENSTIPDYWTEKIADPILAQSVPIYAGCTNVEKYLGKEGYIKFDVNDYAGLQKVIKKIVQDPDGVYRHYKPGLEMLRGILMEKQNLISYVIDGIGLRNNNSAVADYKIRPLEKSWQYGFDILIIRAKRFIYKKYYELIHC